MSAKLNIIIKDLEIKLNGEDLETILETYIKLTEEEKQAIRDYFK